MANMHPDLEILHARIKAVRMEFLGKVKLSLAIIGAVTLALRFGGGLVNGHGMQLLIGGLQAAAVCFALYALLLLRPSCKAFLQFRVPPAHAAALEQALSLHTWTELNAIVATSGATEMQVGHLLAMSSSTDQYQERVRP
ncbi:hypothetical protein [Pseudoduganella sp. HUAS MS19]